MVATQADSRGLSWAGQHRLQWPPSACERQQRAAGVSRLIRVPCLPTVSDKEEGCREEERTAGCCPPMGADNRGSRKNTSFYPCSVKSSVQFFIQSLLLSCLQLLTATSHFALILLVFAPHSFLNPKSLLPSQLALFNCSAVALCCPPPPCSAARLSHLNMPPLSINPLPHPG